MTGRIIEDLTGRKFGKWEVVKFHGNGRFWLCRCDCGTERPVNGGNLRSGVSRSCGCEKVNKSGTRSPYRVIGNLTGHKYKRWTALSFSHKENGKQFWLCRCECGTERVVNSDNLLRGTSRSCGCLQRETFQETVTKHGLDNHPINRTWRGMKSRCLNKNNKNYKDYGGRGIKVCVRWKESFVNFWDDMAAGWRPGLTLERKDVNGNYDPENCIWITFKDQHNNTRRSVWIDTPWGKMTLKDAAKKSGISYDALQQRHRIGETGERLFRPHEFQPRITRRK